MRIDDLGHRHGFFSKVVASAVEEELKHARFAVAVLFDAQLYVGFVVNAQFRCSRIATGFACSR